MSEEKRVVETEFTAKDAGYGAAVSKISGAFNAGAKKLDHFRERLGEFRKETGLTTLAALGLGYGIGSWYEKLKETNLMFEHVERGIAGILTGSLKFEQGATEIDRYRRSLALSKDITAELDETAAKYEQSLDQVATTYRTVSTAAGGLGITQEEVMELTKNSTAMAVRFGVSSEEAVGSITRALQTGSSRGITPFDVRLRALLGTMTKLTQRQRFDHLEKALKGSVGVADMMTQSIGGALSQARSTVEDLLRDATGPVFMEIEHSLLKWTKHLKEMKEQGKSMVDVFSHKLVAGFHTLQDVTGFIKEHWMAIAGIFGAIKGRELAERLGASLTGVGATLGGTLGGAAGGLGATLGRLAGGIIPVIGALAAFKIAIDGLADFISSRIAKSMDEEQKAHAVAGTFGIAKKLANLGVLTEGQEKIARAQVEHLRKAGIVGASGKIDTSALAETLGHMTLERREALVQEMGLRHPWLPQSQVAGQIDFITNALAQKFGGLISQFAVPIKSAREDKELKFAKQINNFNGGIHITQKFEDQDPDRIFTRFKTGLENEISSRTQAVTAEPQGD